MFSKVSSLQKIKYFTFKFAKFAHLIHWYVHLHKITNYCYVLFKPGVVLKIQVQEMEIKQKQI